MAKKHTMIGLRGWLFYSLTPESGIKDLQVVNEG